MKAKKFFKLLNRKCETVQSGCQICELQKCCPFLIAPQHYTKKHYKQLEFLLTDNLHIVSDKPLTLE